VTAGNFQIGSFGGITGGKTGVKRDKEYEFKAEHVAIRTYRVTLSLKAGEYAFFMAHGHVLDHVRSEGWESIERRRFR
jgi:hypothetical protein